MRVAKNGEKKRDTYPFVILCPVWVCSSQMVVTSTDFEGVFLWSNKGDQHGSPLSYVGKNPDLHVSLSFIHVKQWKKQVRKLKSVSLFQG